MLAFVHVLRRSAQQIAKQAFHTLILVRQHSGTKNDGHTHKAVDELIKELNKFDTKEL